MGKLKSESSSGRMLFETMRPMYFEAPQTAEFQRGFGAIDWTSGPKYEPKCRTCDNVATDERGRALHCNGDDAREFACTMHGGAPAKRHRARDAFSIGGSGKLL